MPAAQRRVTPNNCSFLTWLGSGVTCAPPPWAFAIGAIRFGDLAGRLAAMILAALVRLAAQNARQISTVRFWHSAGYRMAAGRGRKAVDIQDLH